MEALLNYFFLLITFLRVYFFWGKNKLRSYTIFRFVLYNKHAIAIRFNYCYCPTSSFSIQKSETVFKNTGAGEAIGGEKSKNNILLRDDI